MQQLLDEKELDYLDLVLGWSLDEFLIAVYIQDALNGLEVDEEACRAMYREFAETLVELKEKGRL